ncbi:PAS domain-containing protein [Marinoscillum sp.]|uniref:PAS domain-containing protein n=1 Tax=Marinoscillum sp. TaxID=2024838 RepID=UPI003BAB974A
MSVQKNKANENKATQLIDIEELANIGSFQWDAETDTLTWSRQLFKIYGYEPFSVELSFDFFLSHLDQKDQKQFVDSLYSHAATGEEYQFEERITKQDGSKAILLSSIKPITNEEGQLQKVLGVCRDVTEVRAHDERLQNQKAFYERILDQLPVQITVKDHTGRFKLFNKSFQQTILGDPVDSPFGSDGKRVSSHGEVLNKLMADKDKEALKTDQECKFETWIPNSNKEDRYYSVIKKRLLDQNNVSNDILTVTWDRTDEYRLSEALRENEERLSVATNGGKLGILDWNLSTNEVTANDTYFEIIGRTPQEYTPGFESFKNALIYKPDLKRIEKWFNENNEPFRIVAVLQDITYRKNYEEEITRSNVRLSNIIKSAPGAVFTFTPEKGLPVIRLSDQISQISGYLPSDFYPTGQVHFEDIIHENDQATHRSILIKTLNQGKTEYQNSFRIKSKNDGEKWIWIKAQLSKNENDEDILEGFLVDITEQVNTEERVISAALQAEDNQRQRISEEIHDGVQQTLISALMGLQHLTDVVTDKAPEIIDQYQMALKTLKSGVEETRSIAHSIMPKSIEDFGLIETIEQVLDQLNTNTPTNFYLHQNLQNERLGRKTEVSLYRIFQEAVNNIIKHANASEVNVQIRKSSSSIYMTIEDDGDGFDLDSMDQLKVGFGLSSMKSRAGSLTGSADISSSPGRGTCIIIDVPIDH